MHPLMTLRAAGLAAACATLFPLSAPAETTTNQEAALVAVLRSNAEAKEKMDACRMLGRVGTAASVEALAPLLADPILAHMARVALQAMPDPAAGAAMTAALDTAPAALRPGLANSLGMRREEKAVPALAAKLADADPALAAAAAWALGRIGSERAARALDEAWNAATAARRDALSHGLLACADAALGRDERRGARKIYDRLRDAAVPVPVRTAALRGAILVCGDDGIPMLLEALRGTNGVETAIALRTAYELPGRTATRRFAEAIPALPPDVRLPVITLLGARGDAAAAPALIGLVKEDKDPALRSAALSALVQTGSPDAVPLLADLAMGTDETLAATARAALGSIPGAKADAAVLALLERKEAPARAAAVDLIALRAPKGGGARLLKAAADPDPTVRTAALRALRNCATTAEIPALLALLVKAEAGAEISAAEGALAALCQRETRSTPAQVKIVKAVYGSLPDGPSADVTAKVTEALQSEGPSFVAANSLFGDTAPGAVKSLTVTYTINGSPATRTVREGDAMVFPSVGAEPACVDALLAALPDAPPRVRAALLRVVATTGGPKALAAVRSAAAGTDAETRNAARRLLCEWSTAAALPVLQELAQAGDDPAVQLLALRGVIRLLPLTDQPPAAKIAALDALGPQVRRPEERKLVLAALGQIAAPEALALAVKELATPGLQEEAAIAAVAIGEAIVDTHRAAVAEAMKKVMAATEDKSIRRRAKTLMR